MSIYECEKGTCEHVQGKHCVTEYYLECRNMACKYHGTVGALVSRSRTLECIWCHRPMVAKHKATREEA